MIYKEKYEQGTEMKGGLLVLQVLGYFVMIGLTTSLAFIGDKPLITQTDGHWCPMFYVLVLQCLVMQHMTSHMMLYHASRQDYNPLDNRLAVFISACCVAIISLESVIDIKKSVISLIIITLICQFTYIVNIIIELCEVLNI